MIGNMACNWLSCLSVIVTDLSCDDVGRDVYIVVDTNGLKICAGERVYSLWDVVIIIVHET